MAFAEALGLFSSVGCEDCFFSTALEDVGGAIGIEIDFDVGGRDLRLIANFLGGGGVLKLPSLGASDDSGFRFSRSLVESMRIDLNSHLQKLTFF